VAPRQRGFLVFLLIAALGLALVRVLPEILGVAGGDEAQIAGALKATEPRGLSLAVEGCSEPLISSHHRYDRISVALDRQNGQARAVATLDFDGKLGDTRISALGVERIPFRFADGRWQPLAGYAPELASAVSALETRRASEQGQSERPIAWFIRLDRDEVLVTEQYGPKLQRPDRRLRLQRREGKLRFVDGLM
jgi:hypothetical protein